MAAAGPFLQAVGGAGGAVFASLVLHPVEVVKTRVQIARSCSASPSQAARDIFIKDGVLGFFRGVGAKGIDTGSRYFVYYFAYDALGNAARQWVTHMSTGVNLAVGYLAGVVAVSATQPFDAAATKLQAGTVHGDVRSVFRQVIAQEGVAGLYRGYGFNLALCWNPAIANTCFDRLKSVILQHRALATPPRRNGKGGPSLTSFEAFALGALTKAIAVLATYPLTRIKTILQVGKSQVDADSHNDGRRPLALQLLRKSYTGLGSQLFKAVLQSALMFAAKERIEGAIVAALQLAMRRWLAAHPGPLSSGSLSAAPARRTPRAAAPEGARVAAYGPR